MSFGRGKFAALLAGIFMVLTACASGLTVSGPASRASDRTVVLFVVDGLAASALRDALASGRMPATKEFFLRGQAGFTLARASFPTLTYPNLASILTARPVGAQPVISNHMLVGKDKLNFESHKDHDELRRRVDPISVIETLKQEGRSTASFSYVLGMNSPVHMEAGLEEGLNYTRQDFQSLDERLLLSLEDFLIDGRRPAEWPEFIYVHLVGVDGTAHHHGIQSKDTQDYLAWLDEQLVPVLRLLQRAERGGRAVTTLLTADHGFVDATRFVKLRSFVRKLDPKLTVLNESRFLSLHVPEGRRPQTLDPLLKKVRERGGVEFTALRTETALELRTRKQLLRFLYGPSVCSGRSYSLAIDSLPGRPVPGGPRFLCPDAFDQVVQTYPYLVENLATFLHAPHHPDALVIAAPGVSFGGGMPGAHGGPTPEEVMVPLLHRGMELPPSTAPIRTSDLLHFVGF